MLYLRWKTETKYTERLLFEVVLIYFERNSGDDVMARGVGRPTKLTSEIQEELVKTIKAGNYIETASAYVGLAPFTVREWIRRGEREANRLNTDKEARPIKSETPYLEFSIAVRQAQAEAEIRDVVIIGNAARESWQAAAWRLERKFPDRWGRKDKHELSGPGGGPVQVEEIKERLMQKFNSLNLVIPSSGSMAEGELS